MADTGTALSPATAGGQIVDTETNNGRSGWQNQRVKLVLGAVDVDAGNWSATNPGAVLVLDGGDATQGAKADAVWSGTGVGSVVSVLKAIWAAVTGATPAGTNVIGGIIQPDVTSTGNAINSATLNAAYAVNVANGQGVVSFAVAGLTASGATLTVQTTNNGTTWSTANGVLGVSGAVFSTLTADSQFRVNTGGRKGVRLIVTTAGTGSITIDSNASVASTEVGLSAPLPGGSNTIGTVLGPLPAAPITGQQTLTTSAVALPANALLNGIVITALATNTGTVYVGGAGVAAATGYPLAPGATISLSLANTSGAYIIGTNTTDKIAFAGN